MNVKLTRVLCLLLLGPGLYAPVLAQENAAFRQPGLDYRLADDLFRKNNLGSARRVYEEIINDYKSSDPEMIANAAFRQAVSAAELANGDAPAKIDRFIDDYPENALAGEANLFLGKSYFRDNKFKDAIKAFKQADLSGLSRSARDEMNFMIGYASLKINEPAAAKTSFQKVKNEKSAYYGQSRYFIAHIDYVQGNYAQALKEFEGIENDARYQKVIPLYKLYIYHYLGDYQKITSIGPEMVESAANNKGELARITGNAFFNTGDYEKAALYLDIYEQSNKKPLSREDEYLLGFVNYKAGNLKNAIEHLQKVIHEDDELSQNAGYYLGICYNQTGQQKYASGAFLSSFKIGIDKELKEEALFDYIKIGFESPYNPYNESIALLETYLEENPGSPRADEGYGYLSKLYLTSRNYKQALASIESVSNKNKQMQEAYQKILFYRAAELYSVNDFDGAQDLYQKASQIKNIESIRVESLFWIGEIFYKQNNYPSAVKYYSDFLESKSARKSPLYARAYYNIGYARFNNEEYQDAIDAFNKFLESGAGSDQSLIADATLRIGDANFISKKYEEAISYYDKVILSKAASLDYALFQKALAEGARGEFNRKIDVLKILINNYPSSPYLDDALFETALAYILVNQENQALVYFDKLIQSYPSSSKAIQAALRKGFIYFNNDDFKQAISSFKAVAEKYPGTQEAQEALAALKNIYLETGDIDQYYAYVKSLTFTAVNTSDEDSISYSVAENFYMQGRCDQAVNSFKKYLDGFPEGSYRTNALFYQAQCFLKSNQYELALDQFRKVAASPRSKFTESAAATASAMEYASGNFASALPLFQQLETVAEDPDNVIAALAGQMRCHYRLKDFPSSSLAAQKLIASGSISPELSNEAHYILAKGHLAQNDLANAETEFITLSKLNGTEYGAEASYTLAEIEFNTNRLADAEQQVYSLSENFSAYDYWVAKGFILLADIFLKKGNEFQAKQTLQSVIENYQGPELGDIAREKLRAIEQK